jgi:hypothetical protein
MLLVSFSVFFFLFFFLLKVRVTREVSEAIMEAKLSLYFVENEVLVTMFKIYLIIIKGRNIAKTYQ